MDNQKQELLIKISNVEDRLGRSSHVTSDMSVCELELIYQKCMRKIQAIDELDYLRVFLTVIQRISSVSDEQIATFVLSFVQRCKELEKIIDD